MKWRDGKLSNKKVKIAWRWKCQKWTRKFPNWTCQKVTNLWNERLVDRYSEDIFHYCALKPWITHREATGQLIGTSMDMDARFTHSLNRFVVSGMDLPKRWWRFLEKAIRVGLYLNYLRLDLCQENEIGSFYNFLNSNTLRASPKTTPTWTVSPPLQGDMIHGGIWC